MTPKPTTTSKKMLPARTRYPSAKAKAAEDACNTDEDVPAPKKAKKLTAKQSKKKAPMLDESSDEGVSAHKEGEVDRDEDKVEVE